MNLNELEYGCNKDLHTQPQLKAQESFHNFKPLSISRIVTKRVNSDEYYSYVFDFLEPVRREENHLVDIKEGSYVAATYDNNWYIGLVMEVNAEQGDEKLNFLNPKIPAVSFHFPKNEDLCWIPTAHIICSIDTPTLATTRGQYQVTSATTKRITGAWREFLTRTYQ